MAKRNRTGKRERQAVRRRHHRAFDSMEQLENRLLLDSYPTVWVNDNWEVTGDTFPDGLSYGDTVANTSYGDDGQTTGKIYGETAFSEVGTALPFVDSGGTVYVLSGTYNSLSTISKSVTLQGQAGTSFTGLNGAFMVTAPNVNIDTFSFSGASVSPGAAIQVASGGANFSISNGTFFDNTVGIMAFANGTVERSVFNGNNRSGARRSEGVYVDGTATVRIASNTFTGQNGGGAAAPGAVVVFDGRANIETNIFANNTVGVRVMSGGSATIGGNTFHSSTLVDNATDVMIEALANTVTFVDGNAFAGNTYFIDNISSHDVTLPGGTSFDETSNYRIEDKVNHKVDGTARGLVTWVTGSVFVTAPGTASAGSSDTDSSIQRGIEAAAGGNLVITEAATYIDDVNVSKPVIVSPDGMVVVTGKISGGVGATIQVDAGDHLTMGDGSTAGLVFEGTLDASGPIVLLDADAADLGSSTILRGSTLTAANGVRVASGDVLSGQGTVAGPVLVAGGTVSPGLSTAMLSVGGATFTAGSTLTIEVNGLTAGSQYDQLVVTGAVDLGAATLSLTVTPSLATGQSVVLIDNEGANPVVGTFSGLADGASLTAGGQRFKIFYAVGTGNDVVLVRDLDSAPLDVYVDGSWASLMPGQDPDGDGPARWFMIDAFPRIQGGVDVVGAGGTINLKDGLYSEANIYVDHAVTIVGQSREGVIIQPSQADTHVNANFDGTQNNAFVLGHSDVTIKNLTIDGGAGEGFRNGIITDYPTGSYGNIDITNISVSHVFRKGVGLYGGSGLTHGNSVTDSFFDHVGDQSSAFEAAFAIAIFDGDGIISGNDISYSAGGIGTNYLSGSEATAGVITISGNRITSPLTSGMTALGLDISGVANGSVIGDNNTIDMTGGSGAAIAVIVQYVATGADVTVKNNTITTDAGDIGVYLYANADAAHPVLLDNNTITGTGSSVGVQISDDGSIFGETPHVGTTYARLTGNAIGGFATGILIDGPSSTTVDATIFSNNLADNTVAIANTGTTLVNASGNWYGAAAAAGVAAKVQGSVDYTPWLNTGTDTSGAAGFQGDFSELSVSANSAQTGTNNRIQEAVDLATAGGVIDVYAGTYLEGNALRDIYTGAAGVGYATGLLVYKNGLKIQGMNADGTPISSLGSLQALGAGQVATIIATNRNEFAGDTIITGDNVTLAGLRFQLADAAVVGVRPNKNVWVNAENFMLEHSIVDNVNTGAAAIYVSDERGGMHVNTLTITDNQLLKGEITITNGVGQSGDAGDRLITNNTIQDVTDWAAISIMGTGVYSWTPQPVGALTITGNSFINNAHQIMARGNDYANPNWQALLAGNTFDKAVITLAPDGDARISDVERLGWISGSNINFRVIGTIIQEGIDRASADDTVRVQDGTYTENVVINKRVVLDGQSRDGTIIDAHMAGDAGIGVTVDNVDGVTVRDLTIRDAGDGLDMTISEEQPYGLFINRSDGGLYENLRLSDNGLYEIFLWDGADNNTIQDNVIDGYHDAAYQSLDGIFSTGGSIDEGGVDDGYNIGNVIQRNQISHVVFGVSLVATTGTDVLNNQIHACGSTFWTEAGYYSYGVNLFASSSNEVANNTIDTAQIGVRLRDPLTGLGYEYAGGPDANDIHDNDIDATLLGVSIRGGQNNQIIHNTIDLASQAGIYLANSAERTTAGTTIGGNTLNNAVDLKVDAGVGLVTLSASNAFNGTTFIENRSANPIDATDDSFGAYDTAALEDNFSIENQVLHALDNSAYGLVRWVAGNVYVTPGSGSIQRGLDVASADDTVNVDDGTYIENVTIGKRVHLEGVGSGLDGTVIQAALTTTPVITVTVGGADAGSRLVVSDLRVTGTTTGGNSGSGVRVIGGNGYLTFDHVTASGNAGNGITLDVSGLNDVRFQDVDLSGNAGSGLKVSSFAHVNGLTLTNATMDGNNIGAYIEGPVQDLTVSGGSYSDNVDVGLYVFKANPDGVGVFSIDGITADGNRRGIRAYPFGGQVSLTNSFFRNNSSEGVFYGLRGAYGSVLFDHLAFDNPLAWVNLNVVGWATLPAWSPSIITSNLTISNSTFGNALTAGAGIGVQVLASDNSAWTGVALTGNTIDNLATGIALGTTGTATLAANVSGNTVTHGVTGLSASGAGAGLSGDTLGNLHLSGQSGQYISLSAGALAGRVLDATGVTFEGVTGAAMTLPELYDIEDKVYHATDVTGQGLVRVTAGDVYVTPASGSIQRGIDAASAGDRVNVKASTYVENVTIGKQLTLDGAGSGDSAADTIIRAADPNSPVIRITGNGQDATHRLVIQDVRVTGATAGPNNGSGILLPYDAAAGSYLTLDNVTAAGNSVGLNLDSNLADIVDLRILNSDLSHNTVKGLNQNSYVDIDGLTISYSHFDYNGDGAYLEASLRGLSIDHSTFNNNPRLGLYVKELNDDDIGAPLPVSITDSQFNNNGQGTTTSTSQHGLYLWGWAAPSFDMSGIEASGNRGYGAYILKTSLVGGQAGRDSTFSNLDLTGAVASNNGYDGIGIYALIGDINNIALDGVQATGNGSDGVSIQGRAPSVSGPYLYGGLASGILENSILLSGNAAGVHLINNQGVITLRDSVISGNGTGVLAENAVAALAGNTLAGNTVGIRVMGNAQVDAGGGTLSSAGNNVLTGYTGVGGNYAIENLNLTVAAGGAGYGVSAGNNDFGPYVNPTVIENYIFDDTDDATRTPISISAAQNQQSPAAIVYVDDDWAGRPLGADPDGIGPATQIGVDAFARIQEGVDAVSGGGVVNVAAGLYHESQVNVTRPMSILGAGAGATTIDGDSADIASVGLVRITASGNVAFSGFTIQEAGAADDVRVGIFAASPLGGVSYTITQNVILGSGNPDDAEDYGFYAAGGQESLVFTGNRVTGTGANNVLVERHAGAVTISGNTLDAGVWGADAIFIMTYGGLDVTTPQIVSGNIIDLGTGGPVFDADHRATGVTFASAFTGTPGKFTDVSITANMISNVPANRRGIALWNNAPAGAGASGAFDGADISGNRIDGNGGAGSIGIRLLGQSDAVTITDNIVTDLAVGIQQREWNGHAATDTEIGSNDLSGNVAAVEILGGSAGIAANDFAGGIPNGTDIRIESTAGSVMLGAGNVFAGATYFINNLSGQSFDLTGYTSSQLGGLSDFEIENRMHHRMDTDLPLSAGLVTWKIGEVFVTADGADHSIQRAIDAAADGSTINVQTGGYDEPLNIVSRNNLRITGAGALNTIITPAGVLAWNVGGYGASRNAAVRVIDSRGITLEGLTFDYDLVKGNNIFGLLGWNSELSLQNSVLENMSVADSAGGYYELGLYLKAPAFSADDRADISILNNSFENMGRVAIVTHDWVDATIQGNTFFKSIADFGYAIEMGSTSVGSILDNEIYGYDTPAASDGSESAGIYIENCFTSGILAETAKSVTISGNEIYDSQYGLWIGNDYAGFAGNVDMAVQMTGNNIHDNIAAGIYITNADASLGSSVAVTLTNNLITANGDAGVQLSEAINDGVSVAISGGVFSGQDVGVDVQGDAAVSIHGSSIAGNTLYGLRNASLVAVDATGNWWGDSDGPNNPGNLYRSSNSLGQIISGPADFAPWLTDGTDTNPAEIGFQAAALDESIPAVAAPADQSAPEGALHSFDLGSIGDSGSGETSWHILVAWGDGTSTDFYQTGTDTLPAKPHTYADSGTYTITVGAIDQAGNASSLAAFTANVSNVAPSVAISGNTSVFESGTYTLAVGAITDPGTDTVSSYTIHWGDEASTTISAADLAAADGRVQHAYADGPNVYAITVDLVDEEGSYVDRANAFSVTVDNVAPTVAADNATVTVNEASTAGNTGTFGDVGVDTVAITASVGTVTQDDATKTWSWSYTPADGPAISTVTITATDSDEAATTTTFQLEVTNVAPTVVADNATVTVNEASTAGNTGTFNDVGADTVAISASVGTVTQNNATKTWSWSYTPADGPDASQTVTITATDSDGAVTTTTFALAVTNVAPTAAIANTGPVSEASPVTVSLSGGADASSVDAAGLKYFFSTSQDDRDAATYDDASAASSQSFTFGDNGTYTVFARVLDKDGGFADYQTEVTVTNVAPHDAAITGMPVTPLEGSAITLTGTAIDPGLLDTLSFTWTVLKNGELYGSTVVNSLTNPATRSDSFTFMPDAQATFIVSLSVTDKDGQSADATPVTLVTGMNPPAIDFNGSAASVNAGSLYTLHIDGVVDYGPNNVLGYYINWGDGEYLDASSSGSPVGAVLTHRYQTPNTNPHIIVSIVDPEGAKQAANDMAISVMEVNPTATLSNPFPNVNLGGTGLVKLLNPYSPSSVVTAAGFLYSWNYASNSAADPMSYTTPTASNSLTVPVSALSTPGAKYIWARVQDTFGGFTDYRTTIAVADVAPVVNLGPADPTVSAGALFTQAGSFSQPGNNGPFTATVDYGDGEGAQPLALDLQHKTFTLSHVYAAAGTPTITVNVVDATGGPSGTGTATLHLTVLASSFGVASFAATPSGFDVTLNRPIDGTRLALYGVSTALESAVTLVGDNGVGAVRGSLVWDASSLTAHFVRTQDIVYNPSTGLPMIDPTTGAYERGSGLLAPANYTVTLHSGESNPNGWFDSDGNALQGGSAGGDYVAHFTVSATGGVTLSLPDFARAPGEPVNVLEDGTAGNTTAMAVGLPISISDASGVNHVDFEITYNPAILSITGAAVASGLPGDWQVGAFNVVSAGRVRVTVEGTTTLTSAASTELATLTATVNSDALYGASELLRLTNVVVNEGLIAAQGDEAVHKVALFGDTTGDGSLSSSDARLLARVTVLRDAAFAAAALTDPRIIGDVTGDGTISGFDASYVSRVAADLTQPQIPARVSPYLFAYAGVDPTVTIPAGTLALQGGWVSMPVTVDNPQYLESADFMFQYDSSFIHLANLIGPSGISLGSAMPAGWVIGAVNVSDASGTARVSMYTSGDAIVTTDPLTLLNLNFSVPADGPIGSSAITIDTSGHPANSRLNEGALILSTPNLGSVVVQATPSVMVADAGGIYSGSAFAATGTVTGVSGIPDTTLEDVGLTFTYYVGPSVSGTGTSTAPTHAGTYTVVASFPGSADYTAAASSPLTFIIAPYAFDYEIGDAGHVYGTALDLAALLPATFVTGINGEDLAIAYSSLGSTAAAHVGTYDIEGVLSDAAGLVSDYIVMLTDGTLTVNAKAFTYTIGNVTQTFAHPVDLAMKLGTTILTGVSGESLAITYTSEGNTPSAMLGTYEIAGEVSDGSGLLSNYDVTLVGGVLTVVTFQVAETTATPSGVDIRFNAPADLAVLNLYTGDGSISQYATADLTLVDGLGQAVKGSLVWDASANVARFVKTGGLLEAGQYTLTLVSGDAAWNDPANFAALDGGSNGGSDNFVFNFTVDAVAGPVVSLPDIARGPGQPVDAFANGTAGYMDGGVPVLATGLPIAISDGSDAISISFELSYDPALLSIPTVDPVALGDLPAGWLATVNSNTAGLLSVTLAGGTALSAGVAYTLATISAAVPLGAIYGAGEVLQLSNLVVSTASGPIDATADAAMHKAVFFGDTTGEHTLGAEDASYIARNVVLLDDGFPTYPLTDPIIVGDTTGDGTLSSQDAAYVARKSVGLPQPQIPGLTEGYPAGIVEPGQDPLVVISTVYARPGATVTVPVSIADSAAGLQAVDLVIAYPTGVADLSNSDLTLGGLLLPAGWQFVPNVDDGAGTVRVALWGVDELTGGAGSMINLAMHVSSSAAEGTSPIDIATTPAPATRLNEGQLSMTAINGALEIDATAPAAGDWYSAATHGSAGDVLLTVADNGTYSEARSGGIQRVVVQYAEPIDPASFTSASVQITGQDKFGHSLDLSGIGISTSTVSGNTEAVIQLSQALPDGGTYVLRLQGVTDRAGNPQSGIATRTMSALVGDVTANRAVDGADIDSLAAQIRGGSGNLGYDLNRDGDVNEADRVYLVTGVLGTRMGDYNLDRRVDGLDFLAWQSGYPEFTGGGTWATGDGNGDARIDGLDFLVWQSNFQGGSPSGAEMTVSTSEQMVPVLTQYVEDPQDEDPDLILDAEPVSSPADSVSGGAVRVNAMLPVSGRLGGVGALRAIGSRSPWAALSPSVASKVVMPVSGGQRFHDLTLQTPRLGSSDSLPGGGQVEVGPAVDVLTLVRPRV